MLRSVSVELDYYIPEGSFIGREVALEGAEMGDKVQLTEPWTCPAGTEFFAYVPRDGFVRVCARNKTGDPVKVPMASYGIAIGA